MQMEAQLEAAKLQAHVQIEGHKAQMQERQMQQQAAIAQQQHQMGMSQMQGQAQLDASKMQAEHGMNEAKSKNAQKTLEQQVAADQQKFVAKESLDALGIHGGLLKGEQALQTAKAKGKTRESRP
jgi:hypothetical protein